MYKTPPALIKKCRSLRKKGFTLGQIMKATELPKVTIYNYIRDIPLPLKVKERLARENIQRLRKLARKRKGKCIPGRIVPKPEHWSSELIFIVAHLMFDGEIGSHSCVYHNRNRALINRVRNSMKKVFDLGPYILVNKKTGVYRISYHYVELAAYISKKSKELKKYIQTAPLSEKGIFLKAFFDDEGCAYYWGNIRKVRGYQHNLKILKLVQKLLKDFDIESKIDKKYKEIVISRKENFIKFRDKINFSKGVYINPDRKNSIWKKKLEKRKILNKIIGSYQK
jgi:hypothetical protein